MCSSLTWDSEDARSVTDALCVLRGELQTSLSLNSHCLCPWAFSDLGMSITTWG